MQDLLGRLSDLDEGAVGMVRVIAYFDSLVDAHVGLETIIRNAAALAGCRAGARDLDRQIDVRVGPDGRRLDNTSGVRDEIRVRRPCVDGLEVWLEREDGPRTTDSMILERFAAAAAIVAERSYGRSPGRDPGQVEILLDSLVPAEVRRRAARRIGLPLDTLLQAVAVLPSNPCDTIPEVERCMPGLSTQWSTSMGRLHAFLVPSGALSADASGLRQAGFGPPVSLLDLSVSWEDALTALSLTASGTADNPGDRQLNYSDLGGLAVLADGYAFHPRALADVAALDRVQALWPWALMTLDHMANQASLRQAAGYLNVHHSTVQQRAAQLTVELGLELDTTMGRLRIQLALALRRVARNGKLLQQ